MIAKLVALSSAALTIAGCLSSAPPSMEEESGSQDRFSGPTFSDCSVWSSYVPLPSRVHPGSTPEGWEPAATAVSTSLSLEILQCNRVSIGHLERGPVSFATEWHFHGRPPDSCIEKHGDGAIVTNVVVDDTEMAKAFRDKLGFPIVYGSIEAQPMSAAEEAKVMRWSITVEEMGTSTVDIPQTRERDAPVFEWNLVRYWDHGSGIGATNQTWIYRHQTPDPVPVDVVFAPPFDGSALPAGAAVGYGGSYPSAQIDAKFQQYEDYTCETPSS